MQPLIVYGVPFSQPVRAVLWLLILKKLPFELSLINPGSKGDNGSRNPNYLEKNPLEPYRVSRSLIPGSPWERLTPS